MAIVLENPTKIVNDAVKVRMRSVTFSDTEMKIVYSYLDSGGAVLRTGALTLTGQDFKDFAPGMKAFKQIIYPKIRSMLNLRGSVEDKEAE